MITTSNIDIGQYSTPYAFGPKRKLFLNMLKRDGKKIITLNSFLELEPEWKDILHRKIIGSIFNVKICGGLPIVGVPIKKILLDIFRILDLNECTKSEAVVKVLNDTFSEPNKQREWESY